MDTGIDPHSPAFTRVPTGISGLDTVIRGGLLRSGMYIVEGMPGAGKTILGNQLSYAHIAGGGRVVYITLVSESHGRMIGHLRPLSFSATEVIGDAMYYLSGLGVLEASGLDGLLDLARRAVRDRAATLLVLDGLTVVSDLVANNPALRDFTQQLQLFLETMGCTTVMLMRPDNGAISPMQTMVDGVFTLRDADDQSAPARYLSVTKFRGSDYLRGENIYTITTDGITVYPRIEALYADPPVAERAVRQRLPVGVPSLDAMLGRGILSGSSTILYGASGTGKTLLGLQFLSAGVQAGEPGLYCGFHETPLRLLDTAERLGFDLRAATEGGVVRWQWQPPLEQHLDIIAEQLLATVTAQGTRRLVLDGLGAMEMLTVTPGRFSRFMTALLNELRARGVTTIATLEAREFFGPAAGIHIYGIGSLIDNVFFIRPVEVRSRLYLLFSIMKMREGLYDQTIRELLLTDAGLEVRGEFADIESVLTGVGRPLTARSPFEPSDE